MSNRTKKVTIKEVAKEASVAIGTVSRYLNNNGYVSSEATERIKKAITDLEFIPNAAARSMINKKSSIIGVTVPEINNPFLADLVVRLEAALSKMNYSIMLCNNQYKTSKIANYVEDLIMRDADGLILVATDVHDQALVKKIKKYLCSVFIGHNEKGFDSISIGDYDSAYQLTKHLIELNHKKIGFIGFNENASQTMLRVEGYRDALKDCGLPVQEKFMLQSCAGHSDGYHLAKQLLTSDDKPTAIITINDFYAINAYSAVADAGIQVGKDISIAGFDDIFISKFLSPSLTTVRYDSDYLVNAAIDLLIKHIESDKPIDPTNVMLSSCVIPRNSTRFLD